MNRYARRISKTRPIRKNSSGEKGLQVNQKMGSEYDTRGLSAMIRNGQAQAGIQKKEEERKEIQPKLLQCKNEDDDKVQARMIQCEEEKKEPVQAQPLHMKKEVEEGTLQTRNLQKKEEDEKVQPKLLQMKKEDEKVQAKSSLLMSEDKSAPSGERKTSGTDTNTISSFLQDTRNTGVPLPVTVRTFMEKQFGADFSQVRIHADSDAAYICKSLKAQAFTHGCHIYFNTAKYNPDSEQGRALLAHELTHVLQQKSM